MLTTFVNRSHDMSNILVKNGLHIVVAGFKGRLVYGSPPKIEIKTLRYFALSKVC